MRCDEVVELLMEVDLDTVSTSSGPLGSHLALCSRCRAIADKLVEGEAGLRDAVVRDHPLDPSDRVLSTLNEIARTRPPVVPGRRGVRYLAGSLSAAAIAGLVALELWPGDPNTQLSTVPQPTVSNVEVPEGHSAAIFRTSDPNITVVWILEENRR